MYSTKLPYIYKVVDDEKLFFFIFNNTSHERNSLHCLRSLSISFSILFVLKNDNKMGVEK